MDTNKTYRCWIIKNDPDEDDIIINANNADVAIEVAAAMYGVSTAKIAVIQQEN